jgi:DNA-binding winged helix-turn-helix (wHTH) protein/tetratricopeptide (TPR) repeat protein
MEHTGRADPTIRFGVFEVDPRSGELRKAGTRIRLQDQPFKVLLVLLEHPGEVVTREELQRRIWKGESFGDFDHGVHVAIAKLRTALGDSADIPRYVETLPRRGYRFVFPVTPTNGQPTGVPGQADFRPIAGGRSESQTTAATVGERSGNARRVWIWGTAITLTILVIGSGVFRFYGRKPKLTERDKIVLADFTNTTGDSVFDGTLRQGLAVELEQSPFLSLVSEKQIQQTLQMMKQQPDAKLTPAIAREICRRISSAAVLDGSIAQIGTQYSLILKAEDCSNGESIASTEVQASDKSHVLEALGKASSDIRKKLGESLATVEKFDTPLEQATTPSLEALQAYDLGYKVGDKGNYAAAIPLFQRAISLDPNFAMAYVLLGMMQWNLTQEPSAKYHLQKAYDLRSTVSERERLFIEYEYYAVNDTGDLENAQRAAALWAQKYPRDCAPRGEAGSLYEAIEQYDKALVEYREAHRLCPEDSLVDAGLILNYTFLDRLEEARSAADEAKVQNFDSFEVRKALYRLAFLQNDAAGMQQQVEFSTGKPGLEDWLLFDEANTAAYFGRLRKSREFSHQAVASAEGAQEKARAAADAEVAALREALVGNKSEALHQVLAALRLPGAKAEFNAALAFAVIGDVARVKPLAEKYRKDNPDDPYVRFIQLPLLAALVALSRNDAPKAIEVLRPVPYESRVLYSPNAYYRGLAYLANHQGNEAATEFQKILDHRGRVGNWLEGAIAHLQIGRAYAMQGDTAKARLAYQDFLTLWKDADPDIPIFKQAKVEYAKLQ